MNLLPTGLVSQKFWLLFLGLCLRVSRPRKARSLDKETLRRPLSLITSELPHSCVPSPTATSFSGELQPGPPPNLHAPSHTHTRTQFAPPHSPNFTHPTKVGTKFLTILIVFEIVIRAGTPTAFCRVPQVLELQEVGPFAPEAQKGGRKSPGQGHQTLGAAGVEKEKGKDTGDKREAAGHQQIPLSILCGVSPGTLPRPALGRGTRRCASFAQLAAAPSLRHPNGAHRRQYLQRVKTVC